MKKKGANPVQDEVLSQFDKVIPGFNKFFKHVERSKSFGSRMKDIRKEIERRFGKVKKG